MKPASNPERFKEAKRQAEVEARGRADVADLYD
jgi:hypothetical protein